VSRDQDSFDSPFDSRRGAAPRSDPREGPAANFQGPRPSRAEAGHGAEQGRDRDACWFELLVDVLEQDRPSPLLLVRYLLAPEELSSDERELLEYRIRSDTEVADQIRVLEGHLFGSGATSAARQQSEAGAPWQRSPSRGPDGGGAKGSRGL